MRDGCWLGIDLGGTKVLSVLASGSGEVLGEDLRPSGARVGPAAVIENLVASAAAAARQAGRTPAEAAAAGLASPGPIDAVRGLVTTPPNFANWRDVPLGHELEARLGIPVALENDGSCGALGEAVFGAGRDSRYLVYLALGTGLGAGIVTDGELYRGATGSGGELGHMVVQADGRPCNCGNRGCIEAYCAGAALASRAAELLTAGRAPMLAAAGGRHIDAVAVFAAAARGDEDCARLIQEASFYLGAALSSILNAFNPDRIVIGGGLANEWPALVEPAIAEAQRRAFPTTRAAASIERGALGAKAAALGAAALAMRTGQAG